MSSWVTKKILILVKTYPTPSRTHQELVCTAGVTEDGQWIRIYPVKFRYLDDNKQFEKWRWIEASVKKSTEDNRPESFKINYDTIKLLGRIESKFVNERFQQILPLESSSMEEICEKSDAATLGIFKPLRVSDLVVEETATDWTDDETAYLSQMSFNDRDVRPLNKIPYNFSLEYECSDPNCTGHKMKITDWELCQAYRNFVSKYGKINGISILREKYLDMFKDSNTDTYLIVGTVHRWKTFIIIGIVNLNNSAINKEQLTLF